MERTRFLVLSRTGTVYRVENLRESPEALNIILPFIEMDSKWFQDSAGQNSAPILNMSYPGGEEEKCRIASAMDIFLGAFWNRYGPYGDAAIVDRIERTGSFAQHASVFSYYVSFVGRLAYARPTLAADLVLFITVFNKAFSGNNKDTYLVGIERKHNPGKGKFAFVGGIREVNGFHFERPWENLIHEAEEEIGLKLSPDKYCTCSTKYKRPLDSCICVKMDLPNVHVCNKTEHLFLLGTFATGYEENRDHLGMKRVYETTAYLMHIYLVGQMSADDIKNLFKAGDDAAKVIVHQFPLAKDLKVPDSGQPPEFGLSHHKDIYVEAIKLLKESGSIY